jgi:Alpha-N-acetylglucosamine transferase
MNISKRKSHNGGRKYTSVAVLGSLAAFILVVMWYFNLWAMVMILQESTIPQSVSFIVDRPAELSKEKTLYDDYRHDGKRKQQSPALTRMLEEQQQQRQEEGGGGGEGQKMVLHVPNVQPPPNSSLALAEKHRSPYAYVWVLGGIREDTFGYKGFLWDVLISANLLRKFGSKADFCIFVRLSPTSKLDDLPLEDRRLLEALGIRITLLEKPQHESFGQLVFDKFLTINMTDYKRVMFLDADVVPVTNLDYIFHLSDPDSTDLPTVIKPNMITASLGEPCNTGIFMVEPSKEGFEQYQYAVDRQRERAKTLPYPYFDNIIGWGHNFTHHGDSWQAVNRRSTKWVFHASHSDQGLMYYWAKYLRQNVTIVISDLVQNWKSGDEQQWPACFGI